VRVDPVDHTTYWDLYKIGGRGGPTGATIDADQLGSPMSINREKIAATKLAYATSDLYLLASVDPPDGQPVRVGSVDYQATGSATEAGTLAEADLGDFSRTREKVALEHVTTDGRDYWTADSIDLVPTARDLSRTGARVKSMTFKLDENGNLRFTPEFGDLIIPVEARSTWALHKMGGKVLGGRARSATRES
jgi:hypothetical protein